MIKVDIEKKLKQIEKMERNDKILAPFIVVISVVFVFLLKAPYSMIVPGIVIIMYSANVAMRNVLKSQYEQRKKHNLSKK